MSKKLLVYGIGYMYKKLFLMVLLIVALAAIAFYYVQSKPESTSDSVGNGSVTESTGDVPFKVKNLRVNSDVVIIDDDADQRAGSPFEVTWDVEGGGEISSSDVTLQFILIDRDGKELLDGFSLFDVLGGGFRSGKTLLRMRHLCTTSYTDGCLADTDFDSNAQYRLKIKAWVCADEEGNYVSGDSYQCALSYDRWYAPVVYSNWFNLSK